MTPSASSSPDHSDVLFYDLWRFASLLLVEFSFFSLSLSLSLSLSSVIRRQTIRETGSTRICSLSRRVLLALVIFNLHTNTQEKLE